MDGQIGEEKTILEIKEGLKIFSDSKNNDAQKLKEIYSQNPTLTLEVMKEELQIKIDSVEYLVNHYIQDITQDENNAVNIGEKVNGFFKELGLEKFNSNLVENINDIKEKISSKFFRWTNGNSASVETAPLKKIKLWPGNWDMSCMRFDDLLNHFQRFAQLEGQILKNTLIKNRDYFIQKIEATTNDFRPFTKQQLLDMDPMDAVGQLSSMHKRNYLMDFIEMNSMDGLGIYSRDDIMNMAPRGAIALLFQISKQFNIDLPRKMFY